MATPSRKDFSITASRWWLEILLVITIWYAASGLLAQTATVDWKFFLHQIILLLTIGSIIFFLHNVYPQGGGRQLIKLQLRTLALLVVSSLLLITFFSPFPWYYGSKELYSILVIFCLFLLFSVARADVWSLNNQQQVLILGVGETAREIAYEILTNCNGKYHLRAFVDVTLNPTMETMLGVDVIGFRDEELLEFVKQHRIKKIVIAATQRRNTVPIKGLLACKANGVEIWDTPNFYEGLAGKIPIKNLRPSWLIFSPGFRRSTVSKGLKRSVDIFFSCLGLLLTLPLFGTIALLIKLDSSGPVFFRQERVGEWGKNFTLFKFRSMTSNAEETTGPVWATENDQRVTRIGRLLRKIRLDELPQLINVLKGEMSFVGPRPERPHFVTQLSRSIPYYAQRLSVKPGITGWAAVKYRYSSSVEETVEKLAYDLYYIKNSSLWLDFVIILNTIWVILLGQGSR